MISIEHVTKSFPGVQALDDVTFAVKKGEVHGLVGENGAGKSTLIKILSGIQGSDGGGIAVDGVPCRFASVRDAQTKGVATIFQELTVVRDLSVAENIFLGREPLRNGALVDRAAMHKRSSDALAFLDSPIDPRTIVGSLSVANQQIVEICKALVLESKILIMDEPTSSLTDHEIRQLFLLIARLKAQGITILYVSHKLEEIFGICDTITVLRDGKHIGTVSRKDATPDEIIKMMVGRSLTTLFPPRESRPGDVLLSVRGASRAHEFQDVSFDLRAGEIIGFAGLIGAGRTELARAIFGASTFDAGKMSLAGEPQKFFTHPRKALDRGIAYLSEDRKREGIILQMSIRENMSLSVLGRIARFFFVDKARERELVSSYAGEFKIKMTGMEQFVESLSGGNQQKVIISKLLATESKVFIFDEPTRGIDVGAKYDIYKIMGDLTAQGRGIIFISSELPEVLGISDRVLCMREGRIAREFSRAEATPEAVMKVLTGGAA